MSEDQTEIGNIINYYGKDAVVITSDKTHVLIEFESGVKLCTPKSTFDEGETKSHTQQNN